MFENKLTIKEYRALNKIHYSQLSALAFSPRFVLSEEKDFSDGLKFGSLIDCLVTHPEDFINDFKVLSTQKPTGQMLEFCDTLFKNKCSKEEAYMLVGFKRDKIEKVFERFENEGKEYYNELLESEGKITITLEEYTNALVIKEKIINGLFTKQYFNSKNEIYYQVPLVIGNLKCLFDMIVINHEYKIVFPIDLKTTTGSVYNFKQDFIRWHYYLQASLYQYCLMTYLNQISCNYTLNNFRFIVASNNPNSIPLIYTTTKEDLNIGRFGTKTRYGTKIKGFEELIDELKWHEENNMWEVPKEVYDREGHIVINMEDYV